MNEYTPVEKVVRAWVISGSHPGYHESQKNLLRENWPTLYNAIEQLVIGHVIEDEYVRDMKAEAWDEGFDAGIDNAILKDFVFNPYSIKSERAQKYIDDKLGGRA